MKFPTAALPLLPLLALSIAPAAARKAPPAAASEQIAEVMVFGNDPCPRSTGDEIIVCGRLPESERFRIPKRFRGKRETSGAGMAWGAQVQQLETVSRQGVPDSCSVVGSGGQSGCYRQFLQHARDQRKLDQEEAAGGN